MRDKLLPASIAALLTGHALAQQTLRVPDDFPTIQAALDAAQTDDTIEIEAGLYREVTTFPGGLPPIERLTIRGEGPGLTVWSGDLDGDGVSDGAQLTEFPGEFAPGVTIQGITFVDGGGESGGALGLFSARGSSVIEDCEFIRNVSPGGGGAIRYFGGNRLTIRRCLFMHNRSEFSGTISATSLGLVIESSSFLGNRAEGGTNSAGAVRYVGFNALVDGPLVVRDSVFVGNTGADIGAFFVSEDATFIGCTFAANEPLLDVPGTASTFISLLSVDAFGRLVGGELNGTNNIVRLNETVPSFIPLATGSWSSFIGGSPLPGGSTFLDPLFIRNPSDGGDGWGDNPDTPDIDESLNDDFGDLRLRPASPAIDAGANDFFMQGDTDLDGNPRLADDPGIPGASVDIGAYEFQGTTCLPDVNQDGLVTPADFSAWITAFNTASPLADQNRDGKISPADFSVWIANFNLGCP